MRAHWTVSLLALLFAVASLASCEGTKYGSHPCTVAIKVVPPECEWWVVDFETWMDDKDKLLADQGKALRQHQANVGPGTISKYPYRNVLVARHPDGTLRYQEFTPGTNATVTIEFPAAAPAHPR